MLKMILVGVFVIQTIVLEASRNECVGSRSVFTGKAQRRNIRCGIRSIITKPIAVIVQPSILG